MDLTTFEARVREAMAQARDALFHIEEEVRERGEQPDLLAASRCYAHFCMHAREYVSHAALGSPRPRRLAKHLAPIVEDLRPHTEALARLGARPTPAELEELLRGAEAVPGAL